MLNCYEPSTASKLSNRYPDNYPKQIVKGKGAYIYDEAGNKYLDLVNSLGAIILGHRDEDVDEAVKKAITDYGTIFSLSHPLEYQLAYLLCSLIPSAEMVRFMHNGKDVTTAAVRLARHITGRNIILSFSYHGASDVFMASTTADKGVPKVLKEYIKEFDYNDIEGVKKLFDENKDKIACVILEPHTIREEKNHFLQFLRDITRQNNCLLIFDEIVTFPRYPFYSVQTLFHVTSDLTCISKGMANGYPISALVGKTKYMKELKDGGVFVSTTFGGNLIGVSAAIATLKKVTKHEVPEILKELGIKFKQQINSQKYFKQQGSMPCRQFFEYKSDEIRAIFWQEMIKEGVFFGVPILFNFAMTFEDIDLVTNKINIFIKRMDMYGIKLEGNIPSIVFKKK